MDDIKSNRKTVRLTDRTCRYIESYRGENFNVKLENLVADHEERADELRREWELLQAAIADKHQELRAIQDRVMKVRIVETRFVPLVQALEELIQS